MKQALFVTCTGCHGLDVALQNRFSTSGWSKIIHMMSNTFYNGYLGICRRTSNCGGKRS